MSCTSVRRVASAAQEERTSPPSTRPPPVVLLLLYYSTCRVLVSALCVRCQEHVQQSLFKIWSSSQIESARKLFCFIFVFLSRDYIPLTFINAREIDKQTVHDEEILYSI